MLFEKIQSSRKEKTLDLLLYFSIGILVLIYFTYGYTLIVDITGTKEPIKITDVITAIGQIATAFAFFLAFWQFKKNSIEKRQSELSDEAKDQVKKMINVLKTIKTKEETNLENLNKGISLLSNLGINFDELFKAMNDDIQKAIVRMHWQDMYFNYLTHTFKEIDIIPLLKSVGELKNEDLSLISVLAREKANEERVIEVFREFVFVQEIMKNPIIKSKFTLKDKITGLDSFTSHFLNDHNLNDHLYGLLSRIDIRVVAPVLAVAEPSDWAVNKATTRF